MADLNLADLESNRGGDLYERTSSRDFGQVDAFVSHSWSDGHVAKWAALAGWSAAFEGSFGRQPVLWLDKACIRQSNIVDDLPCLPIWVVASRRLLVLLGETFVTRLWCAMELYTFVRMGGAPERISVLVPDGRSRDEALALINTFDVEAAQCALQSDREHLLAVIESSFLSFHEFNGIVRSIMAAALINCTDDSRCAPDEPPPLDDTFFVAASADCACLTRFCRRPVARGSRAVSVTHRSSLHATIRMMSERAEGTLQEREGEEPIVPQQADPEPEDGV